MAIERVETSSSSTAGKEGGGLLHHVVRCTGCSGENQVDTTEPAAAAVGHEVCAGRRQGEDVHVQARPSAANTGRGVADYGPACPARGCSTTPAPPNLWPRSALTIADDRGDRDRQSTGPSRTRGNAASRMALEVTATFKCESDHDEGDGAAVNVSQHAAEGPANHAPSSACTRRGTGLVERGYRDGFCVWYRQTMACGCSGSLPPCSLTFTAASISFVVVTSHLKVAYNGRGLPRSLRRSSSTAAKTFCQFLVTAGSSAMVSTLRRLRHHKRGGAGVVERQGIGQGEPGRDLQRRGPCLRRVAVRGRA